MSDLIYGDQVGSFTFVRTELVGKNKTWVVRCVCGEEKVFWKYSAIFRQETCGCGTDEAGLSKQQRRMLNSRLHSYKSGAKKRGLNWNLTYSEFVEITSSPCVYCGTEPKQTNYFENSPSLQKESPNVDWSKYTINFNGVDRVDSSEDYTYDNCVPCCTYCNRAKSDLSLPEFKSHIERVYKWLYQKE